MRTWLIIIVIVLILGGLGVFGYFYLWPNYFQKYFQKTTSAQTTPTTQTKTSTVTDPGVTWIEPKKLDDLKLIKTVAEDKESTIGEVAGYYKIADLASGGELILAVVSPDGPSLPELLRFKKDITEGKYFYLVNNSTEKEYNVFSKFLGKDVLEDFTLTYQSITPPNYLSIQNTTLKISQNDGLFADIAKNSTKIAETEYGNLYRTPVAENAADVSGVSFNLKLADATFRSYIIKFPFLTDDEVALITWSGGTKNTAKFTAEGYVSCGMYASDNVILDTKKITTRLKEAGTTSGGDKIYTVDKDDVVIKKAYENYQIGRTENILTLEQFAAAKPVFVWQSGLGDYVVFTNREYGGLAECGKPVIYLYPEKPMVVSVKVGAAITKSEPLYQNGWTALAYPDGRLVVNDETFPYLFWEGQGQIYPVVNEGVVVEKEDIVATIKSHLAQLGLNAKESADFLDFWLPKMPDAPYIRLTWLGTNLMNKLAPLSVSPAPKTIIRIFLDFKGLDQPINIKPQKLTAIPRRGFTVVEWGGLLKEAR